MKEYHFSLCDNLSLRHIMAHFCYFKSDLIQLCDVTRRTAYRWLDKDDAPVMAKRLLWLLGTGLPPFGGWQFMRIDQDGILHTETGQKLSSGQINAIFWHESRIRMLQDALAEKSAALAVLEAQDRQRHFLLTPANELIQEPVDRQLHLL